MRLVWGADRDKQQLRAIWRFPKVRNTFLGAPIIRTIVFWGLYWGPHILGNYHMGVTEPGTLKHAMNLHTP